MILRIYKLFFIVLVLSVSCLAERDLSNIDKKLTAIVEKAMKTWVVPGAAVAVVHKGKIVYMKSFGVRKHGQPEKVNEQTKFYLASVTKNFTAMVIAKLVDEGKLNWDDKVVKYLPEFELHDSEVTAQFTIRDAMGHRSGLRHFTADTMQYVGMTREQILKALPLVPLKDRFRQDYGYQNIFIGILGLVIEKATGKPFDELLQEYYLKTIGMKNTCVGEKCFEKQNVGFMDKIKSMFSSNNAANVAGLHFVADGKPVLVSHNPNHFIFHTSSAIMSSIEDMAKWMIFRLNKGVHEGQQLLSETNLLEQERPNIQMKPDQGETQWPYEVTLNGRPHYGMGWFIHDWMRVRVLSHMGAFGGVRSLMYIMPEENTGIVVLCNSGGFRTNYFPESVAFEFLDIFVDNPTKKDWTKHLHDDFSSRKSKVEQHWKLMKIKNPQPMTNIKEYSGKYVHKIYGEMEISTKGKKVFLEYKGKKTALEHVNGDIFRLRMFDISHSYTPDDIVGVRFYFGEDSAQIYISFAFSEGEDPFWYKKK